jgi:hypothetical protein
MSATNLRSQTGRLRDSHSSSPPSEVLETHSTNSLAHSDAQLTPDSSGSVQDGGEDRRPPTSGPRSLHLPPLETSFEDDEMRHEDDEDYNEAQRFIHSPETKSRLDDDDDDEGYESHGEFKSTSRSRISDYSPEEEREVVKKLDRKLVLFLAILYLLSFLDRSSQLNISHRSSGSL